VPGRKYHIRIAIADAGDGVLDSGVFLEKNSFVSERDSKGKDDKEVPLDSVWFSKSNYDGVPVEIVNSYKEAPKERLKLNENVEFDLDKSKIPDSSIVRMKNLLVKLTASSFKIELFGHADTTGNSVYNLSLSSKRSKAVRDALVAMGFPSEKIEIKYYGSAAPKVANSTEISRARNRRVEIVVTEQ
jgi:outer membrane protein OmpA-like peptidoglycan-associated protein